ncbi:MAG: ABC transporter permease subunit [Roseburia sp.]|nr:ABC transporter permease subunit [Roseburia sp.]
MSRREHKRKTQDTDKKRKALKQILSGGFWLLVWHVAAILVDNQLLLVTPLEAFRVLIGFLDNLQFWQTILMSLLRIIAGLASGVFLGFVLAAVSYRFKTAENLIRPLMNLLKTVPVVSFVVLLLIWWGAGFLSICICFLIVFPNIYVSTLEGLKNTPKELLEMARVFGISVRGSFFYIYRPALRPFINSGLSLALGMCWKSGVAAEVIGTPAFSIGEQLYLSKIYLDTGGIFAWTAVIIILSILFEKLCMRLVEAFFEWEPGAGLPRRADRAAIGQEGRDEGLSCEDIGKAYGENRVLEHYSASFPAGEISRLTWDSGRGKTTLLRLFAGLERPDSGRLVKPGSCGMLFQEDRLCMEYSALKNVELVTGDWDKGREALLQLLGQEDIEKPCCQLSGGQRRRVALVRAMEAPAAFVLLDEPFTGMDAKTRVLAENYIAKKQQGRAVLMATHQ